VVEGTLAVGRDRGPVGAAGTGRVLAHRGVAAPEGEGGDEARWAGEPGPRQQRGVVDRRGLGGPGGAAEGAEPA